MAAIDVPIQVRWADLDAYGQVNSAAMLTLLEEVRIAIVLRDAMTRKPRWLTAAEREQLRRIRDEPLIFRRS